MCLCCCLVGLSWFLYFVRVDIPVVCAFVNLIWVFVSVLFGVCLMCCRLFVLFLSVFMSLAYRFVVLF